ncbi:hypothetical protein PaeCFBP13512_22435 [Paenibacillus sp. CFBP13512]|uniref:hypothetical protein n=1 Tax=Paenibacillus sp. CFBP13512 TaxID=2184007 RepID=UPI0010BFB757|nr:hypothetical protein [Paenibacillus sp. CFBP13512]TKJ83777.1 hypothetical protein PaeCFBP13512_22435 [Paenibacillus sp. CFBP13512]
MLIKKIELIILNAIKDDTRTIKTIEQKTGIAYGTVKFHLRKMAEVNLIHGIDKKYEVLVNDLVVASDSEVRKERKLLIKQHPPKAFHDLKQEELEELVYFVTMQFKAGISRQKVFLKLVAQGWQILKWEFLVFIDMHKIPNHYSLDDTEQGN